MFVRLPDAAGERIRITLDGVDVDARAGDSVAAAMLAAGRTSCRSTPSGAARGPYCMMGVCFECLVTVDGVPNQQACLTIVAPGMRIVTQRGARSA